MAQLTRVQQKIFGSTGLTAEFAQIGSLAAGSPLKTKDLSSIQSLAQYSSGLYAITNSGSEPPRIEDINSMYLLTTTQLAYMFQTGIPEWDTNTEYYQNVGYVQKDGVLYRSIKASVNQGIDPSTDAGLNWGGPLMKNLTTTGDTILARDGGNVLIGTTSDSGPRFVVADGVGSLPSLSSATVGLIQNNVNTANSCYFTIVSGISGNGRVNFADADSESRGIVNYNQPNDYMSFHTATTEAMRITSANHLLINTTSDLDETVHIDGSMRVTGTAGNVTIRSEGNYLEFSRAALNNIRVSSTGGYVAVITNGRAANDANANVTFNADQTTSFKKAVEIEDGGLSVDTISEYTGSAKVSFPDDIKTDTISEYTEGKGKIQLSQWNRPNPDVFAQIGASVNIGPIGNPALATLSNTDIAVADSSSGELKTYRFNGSTWSQVGSSLSLSTVGAPALAALSSTDVVFIDSINDSLRVYRFNGSTWSQVGSSLTISTVGDPALTALSSTVVAFIDSSNDSLRTYRFSGSTWTQVGSSLSLSTVGAPALAALSSTDVVFIDTNNELRTYRFNGSTWSQVCSSLTITGMGNPALAALSSTDVAFIDSTNDSLRTYELSFDDFPPAPAFS